MPSPFPCSPVIRECSWKKTQIEKKKKKKKKYDKMYMDKDLISNLWLIDGSVQWKKNQS